MDTVRVIVGSTDRHLNNRIEALILDVCYGHADAEVIRLGKPQDILRQVCFGGVDLVILAPTNLVWEASRRLTRDVQQEVLRLLPQLKRQGVVRLMAVGVGREEEKVYSEAGADVVLGPFFNLENLKAEIRTALGFAERSEVPTKHRESFLSMLWRGFQRKSA